MYEKALTLYEKACGLLQLADAEHGAEVAAEEALEEAIKELQPSKSKKRKRPKKQSSEDDATGLEAELHMMLGRITEWKDPARGLAAYTRAQELEPFRAEANLHLGRLLWKCAASEEAMVTAETKIRQAAALAESEEDEEGLRDAQELLGRLLLQDGRSAEAHGILQELGFTHTFATSLASLQPTPTPLCGAKLLASQSASKAVNAFDEALPPAMLRQMRRALAHNANYWRENHYNSPRTGFFSFQHKLPAFAQATAKQGKPRELNIDAVLQHIWVVAAGAVPAVRKAKYCEWWAHARQHCYGHQLHFDSIPGQREGEPRHPIISCIQFLSTECGGPTLVTDQTIQNDAVSMGWLAHPATNRLITFDGSLLHCVLPGAGAAPSPEARRTTFMVAFWESNPHRPEFVDAGTVVNPNPAL